MLNLQCINAPKALNCFSVNITCNGLPMMIKVDYSKLTANEKRDKKISLSSWSLSFSCPSASLFVFTVSSYHLLVLFSFHLVGLWDFLGFGFTPPPPLPRWDVSPLQVTPQHFIRFPWQQYPYIILGGENPVKVECLTQEHNTATCPSLELRALDIYPSLPNISIHILPTVL